MKPPIVAKMRPPAAIGANQAVVWSDVAPIIDCILRSLLVGTW